MVASVNLFSNKKGEINKFLSKFYNTNLDVENSLNWEKNYSNPVEIAEIVGIYIDNFEDYLLNMWISLDKNVFIKVDKKMRIKLSATYMKDFHINLF